MWKDWLKENKKKETRRISKQVISRQAVDVRNVTWKLTTDTLRVTISFLIANKAPPNKHEEKDAFVI